MVDVRLGPAHGFGLTRLGMAWVMLGARQGKVKYLGWPDSLTLGLD
jgi:hypothetical protein